MGTEADLIPYLIKELLEFVSQSSIYNTLFRLQTMKTPPPVIGFFSNTGSSSFRPSITINLLYIRNIGFSLLITKNRCFFTSASIPFYIYNPSNFTGDYSFARIIWTEECLDMLSKDLPLHDNSLPSL
jgi:hypothetical protein